MEQPFEFVRTVEATQKIQDRRRTIVEEQERELHAREHSPMKIAFRKSDQEDRLVSRLSSEVESPE